MDEDMGFDESLFADDFNVWEEEQVFQDHEGEDDAALDSYLAEMNYELDCE